MSTDSQLGAVVNIEGLIHIFIRDKNGEWTTDSHQISPGVYQDDFPESKIDIVELEDHNEVIGYYVLKSLFSITLKVSALEVMKAGEFVGLVNEMIEQQLT